MTTTESRLRDALADRTGRQPSPDLFERVGRSIADAAFATAAEPPPPPPPKTMLAKRSSGSPSAAGAPLMWL